MSNPRIKSIINDEDLNAFAAMHDKFQEAGLPWKISFEREKIVVELSGFRDVIDIRVEAESLAELPKKLGAAMVDAAMKGAARG